uniref:Uncharacterized protein n=1 Tax=Panagrolaimus davidi TaxID=227884 RepID=A0A914PJK9_9BILA
MKVMNPQIIMNMMTQTLIGCFLKNAHVSARHVKTSEKEYIELLSNEHICKIRKYIPEKYNFDPIKQIIKSPNYEAFYYQHRGKSRKTVVVFLNEDKKMCHEYYFCKQSNGYFCNGCSQIGQTIKAVLQKNGNGEECFKINKAEHKCHPRKYNPEKFSGEIIVKKPMYKIIEEKVMGKSQTKLLVFTSKDQKFCYKFKFKKKTSVFSCIKCITQKQYIRASLLKDEEENEFLAVRNKKHLCEPIEYLQTDFEEKKIVKLPNYKIIEKRNEKSLVKNLIIFDENDKNLYYEYTWTIRRNKTGFFRCSRCKKMEINVQANLLYNEEYGGEYIELGKNLHKCKPKQYIPEELSPKIIYLPNFEERTVLNRGGVEKKVLIIFDSNDKNLCYFYDFYKSYGYFVCSGCIILKKNVSAKLFTNESDEKYVQLSTSKQHICQPKKYEPQGFAGKVINAPYFELKPYLNRIKEKKQNLIVYSNEDKTLFYEYRFDTSAKTYLCVKCKEMKKHTFAKLKKNENGQDFVELGPRNHLCKPLKISR